MKKFIFFNLLSIFLLSSCKEAAHDNSQKNLAKDSAPGIIYGSAIRCSTFLDSTGVGKSYRNNFRNLFSAGVIENEGKMFNVRDMNMEDTFKLENLNKVSAFFDSTDLNLKYHALLWDITDRLPSWYEEKSPTKKLIALETHIKTIAAHFTKINSYDVINHPILAGPLYDPLPPFDERKQWMGVDIPQDDLVAKSLIWVFEANPQATLVINEGYLQSDTVRSNLRALMTKVLPTLESYENPKIIDNVRLGWMCHFGHGDAKLPSDKLILETLDYLANPINGHRLKIDITEFDLSYKEFQISQRKRGIEFSPDDEFEGFESWWEYQAYAYKHFYELVGQHSAVNTIFMWGFWDDNHWRSSRDKEGNRGPGLFQTKNFAKKPVYQTMHEVLK